MFNNAIDQIRVYVGNLPYTMRTEELFKMFAQHGKVVDAVVMMEPADPNRSKGFGFVTMTSKLEAEKAIKAVNGKEILGREIICNIAKPREPRFRF
jgi:cold-inducible RNA-binding protein